MHALTELTEKIRQACDCYYDWTICMRKVFLDLQKTFDTVNHNVLLRKLEHYGKRGNIWFKSYLVNRNSIIYHDSWMGGMKNLLNVGFHTAGICFRTSSFYNIYQWSSLLAVEKSSLHHFADYTNLLLMIDKSLT